MPTQGAGSNPAGSAGGGSGSAGVDGPSFTIAQPLPPLPAAVNWDATNRCFTENTDGTYLAVHPVDQQVQTLLTIEQGVIPSLGAVGQRYRKRLLGIPPQQVYAVVLDETKVTLAALIQANDIKLKRVTVDNTVRGRYLITVSYWNLRLPGGASSTAQTATASVGA
jgi:hypothetical protein